MRNNSICWDCTESNLAGAKLWFDVKECQAWFRGEEKEPCSAATE